MLYKFLVKLDRLAAWVLLICIILYLVSGYAMTKGFIDVQFATKVHSEFLIYFILVSFAIHASYAIHLAFKRWRIWNLPMKAVLVVFVLAFLSAFIYFDRFYQVPSDEPVQPNESTSVLTNSNTNSLKSFTADDLAGYDGKNGHPAYVAVDGLVYDLSSVFKSGAHFSHYAGKELTSAFYSFHAKSAIARYPVVGQLVEKL